MTHFVLFFQFAKYGLLCFGGGYMIIPLLFADLVQKTAFLSPESFGNLLSVSQITPGAVSINTATYVGFMQSGVSGSIAATLGLCFPTFVLSVSALHFLFKYRESSLVIAFFKGAKWAAFLMILYAVGLFANLSIFQEPVHLSGVFEALRSGHLPVVGLKGLEVGILVATILLSRRISFTCLIVLSAVVGGGISFL